MGGCVRVCVSMLVDESLYSTAFKYYSLSDIFVSAAAPQI